MIDLFNFHRRATTVVNIGGKPLGGNNPIRVQSMTTTSTNDTEGSAAQAKRIADAGGDYVRLTTQGVREAENLKNINARLRADGYDTPLVADVHFNARVADVAALYAEKVRINPGNYVDPARTFKQLAYTDEEYAEELRKIEARLVPFLNICRDNHTAIRIGVNHGSLSDRIMSRYGDTPEGIVESCMEFLRVCKREHFSDVVISIKASNAVVMVLSVRLLVARMDEEDMHFPLHLGVTEAGEGEDGRIKSAVGIGALLADGLGDTIRVSLSEEPEAEIPVARRLVEHFARRAEAPVIVQEPFAGFNYLRPERRKTRTVGGNIGGEALPIVIGRSPKADYIFSPDGQIVSTGKPHIVDFGIYETAKNQYPDTPIYPLFAPRATPFVASVKADVKFVAVDPASPSDEFIPLFRAHPEAVAVCMGGERGGLGWQRSVLHKMMERGIETPVVFCQTYGNAEKEDFQLDAAADTGALLFDGLCDGLWLAAPASGIDAEAIDDTALGILQAARLRMSKTEYISCPGCGRTLYDLRSTIARIKEATKHLTGLKIGIMGCIVNGPGEMADADYGYVGAAAGKVSLYRRKQCVAKNIPEEEAVERLLKLIADDKQ